jgi:hypothetical protein
LQSLCAAAAAQQGKIAHTFQSDLRNGADGVIVINMHYALQRARRDVRD